MVHDPGSEQPPREAGHAGEMPPPGPAHETRLLRAAATSEITRWFQAAWGLFVSDIPVAVGISLLWIVPFIVLFLFGYFGMFGMVALSGSKSEAAKIAMFILGAFLGLLVLLGGFALPALIGGVYACFLDGVRTGQLTVRHLWSGFRQWWPYTWVAWVLGLAAMICVPFIYILIGIPVYVGVVTLLWLAFFRIVDARQGGIEALSFAWGVMRGRLWLMLAYTLLAFTLMGIGIAAMYIGVLVTVPIGLAAMACCYDALSRGESSLPQSTDRVTDEGAAGA